MGHDISKPPSSENSYESKMGINSEVTSDTWHPDKSFMLEFKGKDGTYGKPPEGSLTEMRAKKACKHINNELSTLLCIIRGIGERENNSHQVSVSFGKLFRYYIPISNKVVGLLLRARRWRLVEFPGEMLYQGQDDEVLIRLVVGDDVIPHSRRFDFGSDAKLNNNQSVNSDTSTLINIYKSDAATEDIDSNSDAEMEHIDSKSDVETENNNSKSDAATEDIDSNSDVEMEHIDSKSDVETENNNSKSDATTEDIDSRSEIERKNNNSKSDNETEITDSKSEVEMENKDFNSGNERKNNNSVSDTDIYVYASKSASD